jgi:hypothetical protein
MTLDAVEFMRRFLLHVLPRGFVKIRHFGYLANRGRKQALQLCATFLSFTQSGAQNSCAELPSQPRDVRLCPHCQQGKLISIARLSSAQLRARDLILALDTS